MQAVIKDESREVKLVGEFVRYYGDIKRLWLRDPSEFYQTVGWCPHKNLGHNECIDCALVLEGDDE